MFANISNFFDPNHQRFVVKHRTKGANVEVIIHDRVKRIYTDEIYDSFYSGRPYWWRRDMHSRSYIYVEAPNKYEKSDGITFEDKITNAYKVMQVIADAHNADIAQIAANKRKAEEATRNAKKVAEKTARNFSSLKKE